MSEGIAIVGMGCRFPDARSPSELWENVLARRRAFRLLPEERLRLADYRPPAGDGGGGGHDANGGNGGGSAAGVDDPDGIGLREAAVLAGWEFDRLRFRVAGATFRVTDLAHWLALEVAAATLEDAGFADGSGLPRDVTGVLVGNTLTGDLARAQLLRTRWPYVRRVLGAGLAAEGWTAARVDDFLARLEPSYKAPFPAPNEESLAGGLSNTIAGRICNHFDLHGGGFTVDGACASSLLAVAQACSALAAGDLDVALAGGVDLSLDPFELVGFARAGALAGGEMRVFDARATGFLPGEGCGFVALMRERQALAWGKRIHGVIRGWGISSDGFGGLSRPEAAGQRLALARAYRRAGCDIGSVPCFEGHGTGTAVGDAAELAALTLALRESRPLTPGVPGVPGAPPAAVGSIKANIGHTKAAAGIAGLLKATLAVESQILPPATGCETPHPALGGADPVLRILAAAEPWPAGQPLRAGVSAMGFGGVNAHVVVEAPDAAAAPRRRTLSPRERTLAAPPQDIELLLLASATAADLAAQARRLANLAPRLARSELGDLAADLHHRWRTTASAGGGERWRAAIVAATPRELADRAVLLAGWLEAGATRRLDERQGAFLGVSRPGEPPPRIGLLFTGQGSPAYAAGFAREARPGFDPRATPGGALARRFAEVADLYAQATECCTADPAGDPAPKGSPAPEGGTAPEGELDTAVAQPAIVAHGLAGSWLLDRLGARASVAVGHSLGELTALCWAGACDTAAALRLAAARGRAMAERGEPGAMASLGAPPEVVAELLADAAAGDAMIAAYNGAARTVVSGAPAAVAAVVERAAARGLTASRLKVTRAFHSPRVAAAAADLDRALATVAWAPPHRPVASTVTGALLPPDADPRRLLLDQVTAPVRFVQALAAARPLADLWIEVGSGRALAELAAEAIDAPVLALDAGGPSLAGPWSAAAALFAAGVDLDPACLFEGRFHRPFDLDAPLRFLASPCESAPPRPVSATPAIGTRPESAAMRARPPAAASAPGADAAAAGTSAASAAPAGVAVAAAASLAAAGRAPAGNTAIAAASVSATARGAAATDDSDDAATTAFAAAGRAAAAPLDLLRGLIAARAELPPAAVGDDSRLLSDLHLNSITVGQLVVEASRRLGLGPPASPTDYALATVAEVADALADRVRRELDADPADRPAGAASDPRDRPGTAGATGVSGIDTWVRPFTVELVDRPLRLRRPAIAFDSPVATTDSSPEATADSFPEPTADSSPEAATDSLLEATGDSSPVARGSADKAAAPPAHAAGRGEDDAAGDGAAAAASGWEVISLPGDPLARAVAAALAVAGPHGRSGAGDRGRDVLLCLPAGLDEREPGHLDLLVTAARAIAGPPRARGFVAIQRGGGGGGFARTVHQEMAGVTTRVIDLPTGIDPAVAALWVAAEVEDAAAPAAAGSYAEAHYDAGGRRRAPVLRLLPAAAGSRLAGIGPADVLLVAGGGKGIGAECALAIARTSGARLAILGRAAPDTDPELAANLDRMEAAGVRALYLPTDVADATEVHAAVARAAAELGPITVLLHAAGFNAPRALGAIDQHGLRRTLAPKVTGARHLLAALDSCRPHRLRLIVGFGSIIARTGLRGEAEYALANEWLALLLARYAARHPACRCLVLDWSVWSGTGMGERLGTLEALTRQGIMPIPPGAGVAELLRLLADPAVRGEVVVTGRYGDAPTLELERPDLPLLRFLETPRVFYPGVELVADVEVSTDTDPYLSDHVYHGEPLLAAVVGLEAMAQAAAAVTGAARPPIFEHVELRRPVAVPPGRATTLRLAALVRSPGHVEVALRERSTAFATDHFRALCRFDPEPTAVTESRTAAGHDRATARPGRGARAPGARSVASPEPMPALGTPSPGGTAAAPLTFAADPFRARRRSDPEPAAATESPTAEGHDEATPAPAKDAGAAAARSATLPTPPGLATAPPAFAAAPPAFAATPPGFATALPGLAAGRLDIDPARDLYGGILFQTGRFRRLGRYRRLRADDCLAEIVPDGTASWFGRYLPPTLLLGDPAARDAAIHGIQACIPHAQLLPVGVERIATGRLAADEPFVFEARERRRDGDLFVYDLDIRAADGSLRERWEGLQLRAVDRTRLPATWSATLLAPYLERRLHEILPETNLRVALDAPAPISIDAAPTASPAGAGPASATSAGAATPTGPRTARRPSNALVESLAASFATATALAAMTSPAPAMATLTPAAGDLTSGVSTRDTASPGSPAAAARRLHRRPDGRPELPGGPRISIAHAADLVLAVAANGTGDPIGCDLEPIAARTAETWRDLLGPERYALAELIAADPATGCTNSFACAATRVWSAAEALHKAGAPPSAPLLLEATLDDGWLLLRAGNLRIATYVATIRQLGGPCALAVATPAGTPS